MHCTAKSHHVSDGTPCGIEESHTGHCCDSTHHHHNVQSNNSESPHSMHWHINKVSFRNFLLTAFYFSLHAVQIYLLIKLV